MKIFLNRIFYFFPIFFFLCLNNLEAKEISIKESLSFQKTASFQKTINKGVFKKQESRGLHLKPFPIIYNPEIKRWILFFSQANSPYIKVWLKRSYRYFPLMQNILLSRGLPKELAAMTLIESNLSPKAVSSSQAVGYWQFIKPTGLEFGLKINTWIDERQDFQKSTLAATKYLYKLYEEFEDWLLAMSAYNMGEARLRKLIKKHETKNFWLLYKKPDFPRETALYVPKILAVSHIIKNPARYGWSEFQILTPHRYDVFFTPGGTNLKKMSSDTQISLAQLKTLNPDLKSHTIPKFIPHHQIRVPKGSGLQISKWLDKQKKSN